MTWWPNKQQFVRNHNADSTKMGTPSYSHTLAHMHIHVQTYPLYTETEMLSNWQLRRSSSKCSQWLIRLSVGMPDNPGRQGRNNNKGCQYNNLGSRLDYICCLIEFHISNDSRYSIRRPGLSQMIWWQRLSLWQSTMLPGVHMLSMRLNDMMAEVVIMTTYDVAWNTMLSMRLNDIVL